MEKEALRSMFDNLLHIWNKVNFWSPKMKSYIYGKSNWVHIINLIKTSEKIDEVKEKLAEVTKSGKKILFVSTKIQWKDIYKKLAEETNNYYISEKWVPGLLTNFKTIKRRISTYLRLLKEQEMWEFEALTKKEKASKLLELEKLNKAYGWLKEMKKIPELIFVVDWVYEAQAIKEANTLKIDCIAILNTNWDDLLVSNCIPANTNSPKSLGYIANAIKPSIFITSWVAPRWEWIKKMDDRRAPIKKKPIKNTEETQWDKKEETNA